MKTIIEDLTVKMSGGKEKELPLNTVIRFEIGNTKLSCRATAEGVEITKVDNLSSSRIMTVGISGNMVCVK